MVSIRKCLFSILNKIKIKSLETRKLELLNNILNCNDSELISYCCQILDICLGYKIFTKVKEEFDQIYNIIYKMYPLKKENYSNDLSFVMSILSNQEKRVFVDNYFNKNLNYFSPNIRILVPKNLLEDVSFELYELGFDIYDNVVFKVNEKEMYNVLATNIDNLKIKVGSYEVINDGIRYTKYLYESGKYVEYEYIYTDNIIKSFYNRNGNLYFNNYLMQYLEAIQRKDMYSFLLMMDIKDYINFHKFDKLKDSIKEVGDENYGLQKTR